LTDDDDPARNDLATQVEAARHAAANAPEAESLHDLGILLLESYNRYGGPALVAEALGLLQQAVKISAADGTGWNGPRGALGAALSTQYKIDSNPATLDEAIDLLSAVVSATPRDPVSDTDHRIALGAALEARVWVTGSEADADAAMALARSVLADTPDDTVDRLVARSDLSQPRQQPALPIGGQRRPRTGGRGGRNRPALGSRKRTRGGPVLPRADLPG
jgi:hypothetical protein